MQYQADRAENIGVLTYTQKHRKTYDTLCLLKSKGYSNVTIFAQAMTYVKSSYPLVAHRPALTINIPDIKELSRNLDYEYVEGRFEDTIKKADITYLLCGAGLLQDVFVKSHRIINAHPGYSPYARGLDAYKWSIYYGLPLGVTTHYLGKYIDAGEIIERRRIFIGKYDTFHSIAQKIYENEIDMLVGALERRTEKCEFIIPATDIFKRMEKDKEKILFDKFEKLKEMNCRSEKNIRTEEKNLARPFQTVCGGVKSKKYVRFSKEAA